MSHSLLGGEEIMENMHTEHTCRRERAVSVVENDASPGNWIMGELFSPVSSDLVVVLLFESVQQ